MMPHCRADVTGVVQVAMQTYDRMQKAFSSIMQSGVQVSLIQ